MGSKRLILFGFSSLICLISCIGNSEKIDVNGNWRAVLISNQQIEIPFNFSIIGSGKDKKMLLINSTDTLIVDDIREIGDSLLITLPFFDSEFSVCVKSDSLIGYWTKHYADYQVSMPFYAVKNNLNRFIGEHNSQIKMQGTWNCQFINSVNSDTREAIGKFKNENEKISGTFLSSTGDYRFLEGKIIGNQLLLSTFDGSHAYLFQADIDFSTNELKNGIFYSGYSGKEYWKGTLNKNAQLPNADSLTFLKDGINFVNFSFPNLESSNTSLSDNLYKNKVVILQIMGTWCPNCLDESRYLTSFSKEYKSKGLEIIGLCYERSGDPTIAIKNIQNFKKRLGINYPLLIAGTNKKGQVNESLPMLKNFIAFPTMIIIDKKKRVRKIHTGFSGPATGTQYITFQKEFKQEIEKLINEKN